MEEAEAAEVGCLPEVEATMRLHLANIPTALHSPFFCSCCTAAAGKLRHQCCLSTCNRPELAPLMSMQVFLQVL